MYDGPDQAITAAAVADRQASAHAILQRWAPTDMPTMRIAVLVHNRVMHDARVIKQATTLRNAGHTVEIHGISNTNAPQSLWLPNTDIPVFLATRAAAINRHSKNLHTLVTFSCFVFLALVLSLLQLLVVTALPSILPASAILVFFIMYLAIIFGAYFLHPYSRPMITGLIGALKRAHAWSRRLPGLNRLPLPAWRAIADALRDSVARRPPPDAIHIHDSIALMAAKALKNTYQVPIVWDAHEIYEDLAADNESNSRINKYIIQSNVRWINAFITINDSIANFYTERYHKMPYPVVIMNAAMPNALPDYDGRLHEAAGLPIHQKILLFQGGLGPKRGLRQLVEAAATLDADWTVVLMGWGNLEAELRDLATRHVRAGPMPCTVFLPSVPQHELQIWSAGASLGIIPYENVGLNHLYCTPNKLWEYPNARVPILCTELVEMRRFVAEYEIGFLLPANFSSHDIAAKINAISDDELARARRACERFIERDNWTVYEPRLLGLYERLQAARGGVPVTGDMASEPSSSAPVEVVSKRGLAGGLRAGQ